MNFLFNETYGYGWFIRRSGISAVGDYVYLYSTAIKQINEDGEPYGVKYATIDTFVANDDVRIWNCIFDKIAPTLSANVDIFNLVILRGLYGISRCGGTFEKLTIYHCAYVIGLEGDTSKTMRNVYIRSDDANSLIRVLTGGTEPQYLVNVDWDAWKFSWAGTTPNVYRQYEFDLNTTFANATAIQNANVTLSYYGQGGGTVGSWLTFANGSIPQQTLSRSFYNQTGGNNEYSFNPYNLTVMLSGYQTYTQNFTLSEKTEWTIALQETTASVTYTSAILIASLFLLVPIAVIFIVWRYGK